MDFLEVHKEYRVKIWENILLIPELKEKIISEAKNWEFYFETHWQRNHAPYEDLIWGPYFCLRPVGKTYLLDHWINSEVSSCLPFGFQEGNRSMFLYDGHFEEGLKLLVLSGFNWDGEYPKFLDCQNYQYCGDLLDVKRNDDSGISWMDLKKKLKQEVNYEGNEKYEDYL